MLTRIINNEYFPSVICQSDEDSDFCNLFNDSYDDYDRNSHHHHNNNNMEDECSFLEDIIKPSMSKHYACPPTSLATLRKRYGTRKSIWGEWSASQTRQFYKSQLPKALEIDGSLGLTLEERAQLASASRHALRTYSRERCHLPGRLLALLYDGIRHMHFFGSWSSTGMTWQEVQLKYQKAAKIALGSNASQEDISFFVYRTIVQKSCSTNEFFDRMAYKAPIRSMKPESLLNIIQSCRSIISWTSSSGGSSSDSMREYERRSRLGGHMLQMESSNILSTVTAGEDRTHELRHLVKPSIAPSLYDTDVTMKMIITSGGENENNNGGSPQPTDNSLTDYSSSTSTILNTINFGTSIISEGDDDASEEYSITSSPQQLTTGVAGISFLCLFMANIQLYLDLHGAGWDHILTCSF